MPKPSKKPMLQMPLNLEGALLQRVKASLIDMLSSGQPSAIELIRGMEDRHGAKARWELRGAIEALLESAPFTGSNKSYFAWLLESGELDSALKGDGAADKEYTSTIDSLLEKGRLYRGSTQFQEMISFMGRFRDYSPFNNMLVKVQHPGCSFFATESHWLKKFGASLKEDARPLVILAPMRPVLLVYDLEEVEGVQLPKEIQEFAEFSGDWDPEWLTRLWENAERRDRIRINSKKLSMTLAGFATITPGIGTWKRRIAIHDALDDPSRFGVLCHELAHVYLGHLGSDSDKWWASRTNLSKHAVEVEAEAVAHLVTSRFGISGASASYVSRHMPDGQVPTGVSIEMIAKVAGRIEEMTRTRLAARTRQARAQRRPKRSPGEAGDLLPDRAQPSPKPLWVPRFEE